VDVATTHTPAGWHDGPVRGLCGSNIHLELAPVNRPFRYFAFAADVSGIGGGRKQRWGFLAHLNYPGGLPELFALSAVVRLIALLPLVFVEEPRSQPVVKGMQNLLSFKSRFLQV
jgi:hypothetical protein